MFNCLFFSLLNFGAKLRGRALTVDFDNGLGGRFGGEFEFVEEGGSFFLDEFGLEYEAFHGEKLYYRKD